MKRNITCFLLAALFIIILPLLFAQQDQNSQGPDPEIAALKNRILVLESKLQTVENVEKMELAAKLADAQAKLRNAEFGKFKNELRESNNEWLKSWSLWFLTVIGIFAAILIGVSYVFWYWLRTRADQLIANNVEKSLDGFKEAVAQVNILKNELRILRKEQAASMLEDTFRPDFGSELGFPKENEERREVALKELSEETLLDVFGDRKYLPGVRHKSAEVLASKSPPLVSPLLEVLNSAIDPDSNSFTKIGQWRLRDSVALLARIEIQEVYDGLTQFLNRLLTENPEHKDIFLTWTVFSLAYVSSGLNKGDSVSLLKTAIPHLDDRSNQDQALKKLATLFDIFNEPTSIKEILTNGLTDRMPEVETECLELLQKHDPDFVQQWQAQKANANTQNEASE